MAKKSISISVQLPRCVSYVVLACLGSSACFAQTCDKLPCGSHPCVHQCDLLGCSDYCSKLVIPSDATALDKQINITITEGSADAASKIKGILALPQNQ